MLLDDGYLRRVDEGVEVAGAIERVELPPTIQALLTARLDRLSVDELGIVERASIEGQVFHLGALTALGTAPGVIVPTVRTLARKQLFRADQAALPGQDAYRFRHILIREAAYERVAKEVRSRWHQAFADWLEALAGERVSEYEELLGHHLAAAVRYRLEIGDSGAETVVLARRAATLFRGVADRVAAQGDFMAAAGVLRRVAALVPADDPARAIALADCAGWLLTAGHMQAAAMASAAAGAAAEASGDRRVTARLRVGREDDRHLRERRGQRGGGAGGARPRPCGSGGDRTGRPTRRGGPALVRHVDLGGALDASLRQRPRGGRADARAGAAGAIALARGVRGRDGRRQLPHAGAGPDPRPAAGRRGDDVQIRPGDPRRLPGRLRRAARPAGRGRRCARGRRGHGRDRAGAGIQAVLRGVDHGGRPARRRPRGRGDRAARARGCDRGRCGRRRIGFLDHRAARPRPRAGGPHGRGGAPKRGGAGACGTLRPLVGAPVARRRGTHLRRAGPGRRSPGARGPDRRRGGGHRLPRHRVPRPSRCGRGLPRRRPPGGRRGAPRARARETAKSAARTDSPARPARRWPASSRRLRHRRPGTPPPTA